VPLRSLCAAFMAFVEERREWSLAQMVDMERNNAEHALTSAGNSEREGKTKCNGPDGSWNDHNIHTMVAQDAGPAQPPAPATWDNALPLMYPCVMSRDCFEIHPPSHCMAFKNLTPKARWKLIQKKDLCQLCFRHPIGGGCWTLGKIPNCIVDSCGAPHHPLLHNVLGSNGPVRQRITARPGVYAGRENIIATRKRMPAAWGSSSKQSKIKTSTTTARGFQMK
jgi:hypothetical protein